MDDKEFRERQEERRAKREEAMRGVTNALTVELGDEILRPIGARMTGERANALTPESRANLHEQLRDVITRGQEHELITRQDGWSKGDDVA